jgi:CRP/FNR family cyclic AMP-dependent transcriptional regulator
MNADEVLPSEGLFHGLSHDELKGISLRVTEKVYKPGEDALVEGQISSGIYFILTGSFQVTKKQVKTGKKIMLATLKAGEFFGEIEFLDSGPSHASVTAMEESRVALIDYRQFLEIKNTNPQSFILIILNMAKCLGKRLRQKGDDIVANFD